MLSRMKIAGISGILEYTSRSLTESPIGTWIKVAFHTSRPLNSSLLDTRSKPDGTRGDPTVPGGLGRVWTDI